MGLSHNNHLRFSYDDYTHNCLESFKNMFFESSKEAYITCPSRSLRWSRYLVNALGFKILDKKIKRITFEIPDNIKFAGRGLYTTIVLTRLYHRLPLTAISIIKHDNKVRNRLGDIYNTNIYNPYLSIFKISQKTKTGGRLPTRWGFATAFPYTKCLFTVFNKWVTFKQTTAHTFDNVVVYDYNSLPRYYINKM